jgi:hypothetical protein
MWESTNCILILSYVLFLLALSNTFEGFSIFINALYIGFDLLLF